MAYTSVKKQVYVDGLRSGLPMHCGKSDAAAGVFGVAAGGADGDENVVDFGGQRFEYHIIATNAMIGFQKVATGYRFPIESTDNDGLELTRGILTQDQGVFTVGTDPAFEASFRFTPSALVDFEILGVGFRNIGDYLKHQSGVLHANITDVAYIGVYGDTTNDGSLYTVTEVNSGGLTATDTTNNCALGVPCELKVAVSAAGVVTFARDLAANADPATAATMVAPTVTQAFTFDDGDVITPFVLVLMGDEVSAGVADLVKLEIKYT